MGLWDLALNIPQNEYVPFLWVCVYVFVCVWERERGKGEKQPTIMTTAFKMK